MADPIREDQVVKIDLAKDLDVPPGQMSVAYRDYVKEGTSRPGTEEPSLIKPAGEVAAAQPGEVTQSAFDVADEVVANTTASVASPGEGSPATGQPATAESASAQPAEAAAVSDVSATSLPAVLAALLETASQQATVTTAATEQSTVTRSTEQKSSLNESAARVPAAIRTTGS